MDRDFLKKIVNDEVLFMNEVATELNITKQGVSNLVSRGQLTPVKTTSTGNLFLKMDVEEYKKQKQLPNYIIPQKVYGGYTSQFLSDFDTYITETTKVIAVFIYFYEADAINDGFYTTCSIAKKDTLIEIKVPTFIIKYEDLTEVYFRGALCGYGGQGPCAAYDVLTEKLHVPKEVAEELYYSRYIKFYREVDGWKFVNEYRNVATKDGGYADYEMHSGRVKYLYNNNLVVVQKNLNRIWLEDDPAEFVKKNFYYVPNPKSVTIYSKEMAIKTGHYISTTTDMTVYQVIIKDESGKELWLDMRVNEKIPLSKQCDVMSVLNAADIMLETKDMQVFPDFIRNILNKRITVQDNQTFGKKSR